MICLKGNAGAAVILLHEIYGINRHIRESCSRFRSAGFDVYCPDLYPDGRVFSYAQQQEAYEYFTEHAGFSSSEKIAACIRNIRPAYKTVFLIGYSVGASIAWKCSASGLCDGVIGYYGSRIRDFMDVVPKCQTLLIFASEESSFDPSELHFSKEQTALTDVHILNGRHGFCDPFSENFNPESAADARQLTVHFLKTR